MDPEPYALLRCPACAGALGLRAGRSGSRGEWLECGCGRRWAIRDGVPDLVHPETLAPSDAEFLSKYEASADRYDVGLEWLFQSFGEDQESVREGMVELLDVATGARVLDLGCGTGSDAVHIARRLGSSGELYLLDLSPAMLARARTKLQTASPRVESLLANAAYLPFPDRVFDAVFHFGGINEFGERRRALLEMARVARIGARIVFGDEGLPPWLRRTRFGRVLVRANPLYRHRPPLDALPVGARDVRVRWVLGSAFYLVDFRVGEGTPPLDLDLPIPGKGDTLRSRYERGRG